SCATSWSVSSRGRSPWRTCPSRRAEGPGSRSRCPCARRTERRRGAKGEERRQPVRDGDRCRRGGSAGGALRTAGGEPGLAQLAALLLGGAAPDAGLLVGGQREVET